MIAICGCCNIAKEVVKTELSPNGFACVDCAVILALSKSIDTIGTVEPQEDTPGPSA